MIGAHIEFISIVTGALTALEILQFVAPAPMLRIIYGEAPQDAASLALARHWDLLIFLIGALLIYVAFYPVVRGRVVVVAAIEKIALGVGVLGTSLRHCPVACRYRKLNPAISVMKTAENGIDRDAAVGGYWSR